MGNFKQAYKELRKRLKNKYEKNYEGDFNTSKSVLDWVTQHKIIVTENHTDVLHLIHDMVAIYPYQEKDRSVIVNYLKNNKYKAFKKDKL